MKNFIDGLKDFQCYKDYYLENDGYIGIPVKISVLFDYKNRKAVSGFNGTDVILYVVGANIERIGNDSDYDIVASMLERGYVVCVMDYMNNEKAVPPSLDWSVQGIRQDIIAGKYFEFKNVYEHGFYYNTYVVPAGYNVSLHNVYWSIDKHSTDGTLEKITEIWNWDFRGANRNCVIKWTDEKGDRKPTQKGFDGSDPVWLNKKSEVDENGEYLKICYTKAETVTDCVKKDGTPIDMDLYMYIIYPTSPVKKTPLMCLNGSSEHLASCSANHNRPHFNGFAFLGYAVATFDHGYVPMARNDHYGYYDGNWVPGHISGDNATYSISFYNDKLIHTAAIRYLRYLALSDERFAFDVEKVGIFGNSKGGCMQFLGEDEPEKIVSWKVFPEKYDKTRFENGQTKPFGFIRGAEEQPWQEYNGSCISSKVQLINCSCGSAVEYITKGHVPTFVTCNKQDEFGNYFGSGNLRVNACRTADVPTLWFEVDQGHTLATDKDMNYGVDTYSAFFDFANYYLKDFPVKVVYSVFTKKGLTVKFLGSVLEDEISKIKISSVDGKEITGEWSNAYGKTEWNFASPDFEIDKEYVITVPVNFKGDNKIEMGEEYKFVFKAGEIENTPIKALDTPFTRKLEFDSFKNGKWTECAVCNAPDGSKSLKLNKICAEDTYFCERFHYNPIVVFENDEVIKNGKLTDSDLGRRFKISFKIYDTATRYLQVKLNSCTNVEYKTVDYNQNYYNYKTIPNEWQEFTFDYVVYEPAFGEVGLQQKVLTVSGMFEGEKPKPIYFKDFTVVEY